MLGRQNSISKAVTRWPRRRSNSLLIGLRYTKDHPIKHFQVGAALGKKEKKRQPNPLLGEKSEELYSPLRHA